MALSDYQPERLTVTFKGGSFDVRGITLIDLATLLRDHLVDLDKIVAIVQADMPSEREMVSEIVAQSINLIKEAPGLVANLIALASDEPDSVDTARSLPMYVQVDALTKTAKLTFEEAGGAKKFVESLASLLTAFRPVSQ